MKDDQLPSPTNGFILDGNAYERDVVCVQQQVPRWPKRGVSCRFLLSAWRDFDLIKHSQLVLSANDIYCRCIVPAFHRRSHLGTEVVQRFNREKTACSSVPHRNNASQVVKTKYFIDLKMCGTAERGICTFREPSLLAASQGEAGRSLDRL